MRVCQSRIIWMRPISEVRRAGNERSALIRELHVRLKEVQRRRRLLPVCRRINLAVRLASGDWAVRCIALPLSRGGSGRLPHMRLRCQVTTTRIDAAGGIITYVRSERSSGSL